ncbi:DUF1800 domain-containing protein [Alphaproteobacteria bacterium]|nr:DUF1800 domain-containing protein [Alphaproteobacteria bacterium]
MKNSFFRKIGFGLKANQETPDNPVEWAINQITKKPDYTWQGEIPLGSDLLKIYGNFIYHDRKVLRKKFKSDPAGYKKAKNLSRYKFGEKYFENLEISIRHDAAINGKLPVCHRLLHFWGNHFAISKKDYMSNYTTGPYHREIIGPALTGNFFDLLKSVTTSWSMIHHLDNSDSIGPSSEIGRRRYERKGKVSTINENHARELLELHTVSPISGYTQNDVINATYLMTGWEHRYLKNSLLECGPVRFDSRKHEPGEISIMGKTYRQKGLSQKSMLYELLEDLANHPSTRKNISWKLCKHFISDNPPLDAINAVEHAWKVNNGNLISIHQAVIEQTWKYTGIEKKFLMPETWLLQVVNMSDAISWPNSHEKMNYDFTSKPNGYVRRPEKFMRELGHSPFRAEQPNGFPDTELEWMSPELLIRRLGLVNIEKLNRLGLQNNNITNILTNNFDNSDEILSHFIKLKRNNEKLSFLFTSSWMLKV